MLVYQRVKPIFFQHIASIDGPKGTSRRTRRWPWSGSDRIGALCRCVAASGCQKNRKKLPKVERSLDFCVLNPSIWHVILVYISDIWISSGCWLSQKKWGTLRRDEPLSPQWAVFSGVPLAELKDVVRFVSGFRKFYGSYANHGAGIWIPTFAIKSPSYVGVYMCLYTSTMVRIDRMWLTQCQQH
jgi:hypothetical protein